MTKSEMVRTVIRYHAPVRLTTVDVVRLIAEGASGTEPTEVSRSTVARVLRKL